MSDYNRIAEALVYLKTNFQRQPTLGEVAETAHLSPHHFQRLFSRWAGVSPKKFLQYLSVRHAKSLLQADHSLAETAFQTGLSGTGRLHDMFMTIEGMTPGEYKQGGAGLTIRYSLNESRFGQYLVASTNKGICNLLFFDGTDTLATDALHTLWPRATCVLAADERHRAVQQFLNKAAQRTPLHLHLRGTDFQLKVWEALLRIPEGQLSSYGQIAEQIGQPTASRAVGTAIGSNPVGYLIPCHRVIKSTGGIGDYRWGTTRKMAMIGWEGAQADSNIRVGSPKSTS